MILFSSSVRRENASLGRLLKFPALGLREAQQGREHLEALAAFRWSPDAVLVILSLFRRKTLMYKCLISFSKSFFL